MSEDSGCADLIAETSSLTLRTTIWGKSWTISALLTRMGWPTNSGRSCMSILRPKNPSDIATQLITPAAIGANNGFGGGAGAGSVLIPERLFLAPEMSNSNNDFPINRVRLEVGGARLC